MGGGLKINSPAMNKLGSKEDKLLGIEVRIQHRYKINICKKWNSIQENLREVSPYRIRKIFC